MRSYEKGFGSFTSKTQINIVFQQVNQDQALLQWLYINYRKSMTFCWSKMKKSVVESDEDAMQKSKFNNPIVPSDSFTDISLTNKISRGTLCNFDINSSHAFIP